MPRVAPAGQGAAYPAMTKVSTIKAGPKFSFGTAGLRTAFSPRDAGGCGAKESSVGSQAAQASPRGPIPVKSLQTPGPGAYEVKPVEKQNTQASWPFGCSTQLGRLETPREITPGPGDYESKPGAMRGRQYRGAGRPQSNGLEAQGFGSSTARKIASPRSLSPSASVQSTKPSSTWNTGTPGDVGPGTYNADKLSLARAAGARFGASHRFSPPERTGAPGPGSYENTKKSLTKGHQFGNSVVSRNSIVDASSTKPGATTPGPAYYDTVPATRSTKKRMPGFSMPGRGKETRETSPGPADYGGHYTLFT